jgi:hypothetical protein
MFWREMVKKLEYGKYFLVLFSVEHKEEVYGAYSL